LPRLSLLWEGSTQTGGVCDPTTNVQVVKLTSLFVRLNWDCCAPERTAKCRLKSYLAGFVLAEIGCKERINERRYRLWKWSVHPWWLASLGFVVAKVGCGGRVYERRY
jgi:hypothetical protein